MTTARTIAPMYMTGAVAWARDTSSRDRAGPSTITQAISATAQLTTRVPSMVRASEPDPVWGVLRMILVMPTMNCVAVTMIQNQVSMCSRDCRSESGPTTDAASSDRWLKLQVNMAMPKRYPIRRSCSSPSHRAPRTRHATPDKAAQAASDPDARTDRNSGDPSWSARTRHNTALTLTARTASAWGRPDRYRVMTPLIDRPIPMFMGRPGVTARGRTVR